MQMQMSIHIDMISLSDGLLKSLFTKSVNCFIHRFFEEIKWVYSECDELKLFLNVSQLLLKGVLSVLELTTQARHESIRGVFARQFLNHEPCNNVAKYLWKEAETALNNTRQNLQWNTSYLEVLSFRAETRGHMKSLKWQWIEKIISSKKKQVK